MKAEDRLKELIESGEINSLDAARQEGFIKGWNEALRINDVVGRSEQYCDWCSSTEEVEVKICKKCRQGMDKNR